MHGEYILRIISIDYKFLFKEIKLTDDTVVNLLLTKSDNEIDEVVISANKEIYKLETDKRIYLLTRR